jgi:UDP-N-acetylmuramoyl-tripeptide--D-alanyl-D-alanine ligase
MNPWSLEALRGACGPAARFLTSPAPSTPAVTGLSIDSRALSRGQAFLALRGERFDGHGFLAQAVEAGAGLLIVEPAGAAAASAASTASAGSRTPVLVVPETRRALGMIAAAHRRALRHTAVVAICGSNGKTTTTAMIGAVLRTTFRGTAPAKSFNNDVGVPLTVLSAALDDDFLLCEVGSNNPGEVAPLAAIVAPTIAVVTSIGREHLLGFGSIAGVVREEASVIEHLPPHGCAVVTADSPALARHLAGLNAAAVSGTPRPRVTTFGRAAGADLRLTSCEHVVLARGGAVPCGTTAGALPDGVRFTIEGTATPFELPTVGEHNALNALAAIAVGRTLGLSDQAIREGLRAFTPPAMRLARHHVRGVHVVNDAYNANPESTLAALRTFVDVHRAAARRVVVLGDNLELGDAGEAAHIEIGAAARDCGAVDLLITVGPLAAIAGAAFAPGRTLAFPDAECENAGKVAALFVAGDAVLLKGSRRIGLERVVKALEAAPAPVNA